MKEIIEDHHTSTKNWIIWMESDRLLINTKDDESFKARPGQIEFIMFWRVLIGLFSNKGNYERG